MQIITRLTEILELALFLLILVIAGEGDGERRGIKSEKLKLTLF